MKTQPIGIADQVSFGDVMRAYARQHGLRRPVAYPGSVRFSHSGKAAAGALQR